MVLFLGRLARSWVQSFLGQCSLFVQVVIQAVGQCFQFRFRFLLTVDEFFRIGVESLPIVAGALTFISLMLVIEFSFHMKLVIHDDSLVPAFSTVLMIRELGPVVTAMLLASRVGASIAAEIATMKTTEQIDALRLLQIDPVGFLVVPRWVASVAATIALSVTAVAVSIFAAAYLAAAKLGYFPRQFLNTMFTFTHTSELISCVIKAAVFGSIIPVVASYHGMNSRDGAQGVGEASTYAVVESFLLIIICDFFLTYLFYSI